MRTSLLYRTGNAALAVVTCFMLAGCGIYGHYRRPAHLPTDSLYRACAACGDDTLSLAQLSWRELFSDSLLAGYIAEGLAHNTDLQTARCRIQEARATLRASRQAFLPSLSLEPQAQASTFDGGRARQTYSVDAVVQWEIDAFGALRNAKKGSYAAWQAEVAYGQAVQTQLVASIAQAYYSLVALDQKLDVTRQAVEQWQEQLRVMRALKRAGQQNEAAVSQCEASLLDTEGSVHTLTRQIYELENTLSVLLGRVPSGMARTGTLAGLGGVTLDVGLPASLLARRPDVRQAEWQLAEACYATQAARSSFYPKITLGGSIGWTNNGTSGIVNPGGWLLSAMASAVQPLFNRGTIRANLDKAKARQQEAMLAFVQRLLDAGAEVNNALMQCQTSRRQLSLQQQRVQAMQRTLATTQQLMYHSTTTTYLEVISARQQLLDAQLALIGCHYEEVEGVISLYHALGGGAD